MSSHMMSEVEDLCSSVILIHSGRLLYMGTPKGMVEEMLGANIVRVQAGGLTPELVESIRKTSGVIEVVESDGWLEVRVGQGVEVRPTIARLVSDAGAELLTMTGGERMLERAYIEALRSGRDEGK